MITMKLAVTILTILLGLAVHAEPQSFRNAAPSGDSRPAASPFLRKRNAIEGRQAQLRKTEDDATEVRQAAEANQTAISQADPSKRLAALKADLLHPAPDLHREAVDASCKHLIPGMKRFQCGVDGAILDLLSLEEGNDDNGFKNPVVYFTCKQGKKTRIPPRTGEVIYDEPDQIDGVAGIPGGIQTNKAAIMKSRSDVSRFIAVNGGFGDFFGLFKLSASYSKMTSMVEEHNKTVASSSEVVPVFNARMLPYISLKVAPPVEEYIEKHLKKPFKENPKPYREFINQWGTHFFRKANFGGLIRVLLEIDSSFAEKQKQNAIGIQASGVIQRFKFKGGFKSESKLLDSEFQQHSSVTTRVLGGEYGDFVNEGFKGWQPTIANRPWPYNGKLLSIHLLFKDPKKRKEMQKAIEEHMIKAQLEAGRRMAKIKLPELMGDLHHREMILQSYIKECEELMIKDFPMKAWALALYKKIEKAMLWEKKADYRIFDGMQEAINGVRDMKKKYGNGVSTQIVVGNLLSDKLEYENHATWHGKWQNRYLVEIPAGKWLACLHVKSSWSMTGSKGWVGWKNGKMIYEVGWVTPWSGTNGFGMQIKEGNQKSPKSWTYYLRSKTVITSPDGTTEMTGWFDLNRASTRVIYKISKAAAS